METVRLLLLTLLPALVLACIVGLVVGRYQVKKAQGQLKSVFSPRQWVCFAASIALGVACILVGIFYHPNAGTQWDDPWFPDEMDGGSFWMDGEVVPEWDESGFEGGLNDWPDEIYLEPSEEISGEYSEEIEGEQVFTEDDYLSDTPDLPPPSPDGGSVSAQPMPRPASPGGVVRIG